MRDVKPPGLPRAWLKARTLQLVEDGNRHRRDCYAFEFLTGRSLSAGEKYGDRFARQLGRQGGDPRPASRVHLAVNGPGMQFVRVR